MSQQARKFKMDDRREHTKLGNALSQSCIAGQTFIYGYVICSMEVSIASYSEAYIVESDPDGERDWPGSVGMIAMRTAPRRPDKTKPIGQNLTYRP
jgi:hypothetical protein